MDILTARLTRRRTLALAAAMAPTAAMVGRTPRTAAQAMPDRTYPLWADVPPGGTVQLTVPVVTPPMPGTWTLEVSVVQRDVGAFRVDGADALSLPVVVAEGARQKPW